MNSDFTICLGRSSQLHFNGCHDEQGYQVTLAETGLNTMTGGRVKRVQRYIGPEPFMATYGDGLSNVDIRDLVRFHEQHGRLATLVAVRPTSRFGMLDLDGPNVSRFHEKPQMEGWVNAGFFVFNPGVFDYLDGDDCVLEQKPLERLCADGELMAYQHDGFFFAMDTYREYMYLNSLWDSGQPPWRVWP